jgi:nicotinamidase-related amidase
MLYYKMSKKYLTNRSKRSVKRNRRKRGLTKRYNKSRRGGYNKSKKKMLGGMDQVPVPGFQGNKYVPMHTPTTSVGSEARRHAQQVVSHQKFKGTKARGVGPPGPARAAGPAISFTTAATVVGAVTKFKKWSAWAHGTPADKALSEKALSEQNDTYKRILDEKKDAHAKVQARIEQKKKMLKDKLDDPDTKAKYTQNINAWISQMIPSVPPSQIHPFSEARLLDKTIKKTCKTESLLKQLYDKAHTISEDSVLFVIDMQNDFVGPSDFQTTPKMDMFGARFAVSEGPYIDDKMVELIEGWPGKVILSRDYHPHNHCSFASSGKGNYPTHCVQGTRGSYFTDNMEKALMTRFKKNQTTRNNTYIVFKGCWESIDSYGAAKYDKPGGAWADINGTQAADAFYVKQPQNPEHSVTIDTRPDPDPSIHNPRNVLHDERQDMDACSKIDLTGSFYLQCSALTELGLSLDAATDAELRGIRTNLSFDQAFLDAIRSGPDVNAINEKNEKLNSRDPHDHSNTINKRVEEIITGDPNIYVVGLALDYCCTDTAVNLAKTYTNVNLVMNLCRPPVIPLGVPGLTLGDAPFADSRHMIAVGSDLRWLTKRLAMFRGSEEGSDGTVPAPSEGSDGTVPAWWFLKEILPTTVNLIWAVPA